MIESKSRSVDLILKNAKIFVNKQIIEGGLAVNKGKIVGISKDSKLPIGEMIINLRGQLIIPGVIDIHAHLRDLNYSKKEDFFTGTCAAASGGITTVIDMPNTSPPTISSQLIEQKMILAQKKIIINTGFYAGIPDRLNDINSCIDQGIFGFKLYLSQSLGQFDIDDPVLLQTFLQRLHEIHYPLLIHAERKIDIERILDQKKDSKLTQEELYLESHSEDIEKLAIEYIFRLNAEIGAVIHICHVTTASGLELIKKRKAEGGIISAEVTPHHLLLSKNDLKLFGTFAKMLPPLRTPYHSNALWNGLIDETIDIIATDHAPHMLSEKECDFSLASNGIPGFETFVPLLFTAMHNGKISLSRLIAVISENPSKFLYLSNKGKIAVGYDADLTIIDLNRQQRINASNFYSKAKFSPFDKREVKGIPTMTIVNGKIIMQDGDILVPKGSGTVLRSSLSQR